MIYQDEQVRLHKTNSVNSVNKEACLNTGLQSHRKKFPFPAVSDAIDQRVIFEQERAASKMFRLILTINPFCTNVLFNAATELVQNEGTNIKGKLLIVDKDTTKNDVAIGEEILGVKKPNNYDMIRNTEYANGSAPFQYHCGFDIFNNHKLRNLSFKPVMPLINGNNEDRKVYNTLEDYMRDRSGNKIPLTRRTKIEDIEIDKKKRRLYLKDDILSYDESIEANLQEVNGWFGFRNNSSIPTKTIPTEKDKAKEIKNSKVFNEGKLGCEFVEMYPDSSLYSFKPKYNAIQHREEYNWDICLTYPYENETDGFDLIQSGDVNAVYLADYDLTIGTSGEDAILFRSLIKHNLAIGDNFILYYKLGGGNFKLFENHTFRVKNVGDLQSENSDYYFYIDDISLILQTLFNELNDQDKNSIKENKRTILKDKEKYTIFFRFAKVSEGEKCQYYVRKFRKLPNLRKIRNELTQEICENKTEFEKYISENCTHLNKRNEIELLPFAKEMYPLAFAKTIYGDDVSQITFTDTIDLSEIRDNLGRPLTTIYATIIKRNKGNELWYKKVKTKDELEDIEYSHCFGPISCGFVMHSEKSDTNVFVDRKIQGDVTTITNDSESNIGLHSEKNITIDTDVFYGDVVEFDKTTLMETILSDVCFRFNTLQRETKFDELGSEYYNYSNFSYDVFKTDDYDRDGFSVEKVDETAKKPTYRKEGYYYKAHYPIVLRDFSKISQASNKFINVKESNVIQTNGLNILVLTKGTCGVTTGDMLVLKSQDKTKQLAYKELKLFVTNVLTKSKFTIKVLNSDSSNSSAPNAIVKGIASELNSGNCKLLLKNPYIPSYAMEVYDNLFVWRNVLNSGDVNAKNIKEYPFANNHFYVNKNINFFLKRQDPYGYNGLLNKDIFPCDVYNREPKTPTFMYKDDSNVIC